MHPEIVHMMVKDRQRDLLAMAAARRAAASRPRRGAAWHWARRLRRGRP